MTHERAEAQGVRLDGQMVKGVDAIYVDEMGGRRDAHVQHGHEALPARQYTAILARIAQGLEAFFQCAGRLIFKPGSFHAFLTMWMRLRRLGKFESVGLSCALPKVEASHYMKDHCYGCTLGASPSTPLFLFILAFTRQ